MFICWISLVIHCFFFLKLLNFSFSFFSLQLSFFSSKLSFCFCFLFELFHFVIVLSISHLKVLCLWVSLFSMDWWIKWVFFIFWSLTCFKISFDHFFKLLNQFLKLRIHLFYSKCACMDVWFNCFDWELLVFERINELFFQLIIGNSLVFDIPSHFLLCFFYFLSNSLLKHHEIFWINVEIFLFELQPWISLRILSNECLEFFSEKSDSFSNSFFLFLSFSNSKLFLSWELILLNWQNFFWFDDIWNDSICTSNFCIKVDFFQTISFCFKDDIISRCQELSIHFDCFFIKLILDQDSISPCGQ